MDTVAANKKLVVDFLNTVFNDHDVDGGISRFMAPVYRQHNPGVGDGVEAFRAFFKAFFAERPAATFDIKRVFCEGDFVTIHAHWRDHPGDRGQAVMDIFRVENGKVAEHWDVMQAIPEKLAHDNTMF
jgi:predicted SnoaL-like aldol condensation-catalyzing enzyme